MLVEKRDQFVHLQLPVIQQMEDDARVERAATRARDEAVQCRKPNTYSSIHGAQTGTAAEMGDDHLAASCGSVASPNLRSDMAIEKPVKPIPNAGTGHRMRKAIDLGDPRPSVFLWMTIWMRPGSRLHTCPRHTEFRTRLIARRCRRLYASLQGLSRPGGLSYCDRRQRKSEKLTNRPKAISLDRKDLADDAQFKL